MQRFPKRGISLGVCHQTPDRTSGYFERPEHSPQEARYLRGTRQTAGCRPVDRRLCMLEECGQYELRFAWPTPVNCLLTSPGRFCDLLGGYRLITVLYYEVPRFG